MPDSQELSFAERIDRVYELVFAINPSSLQGKEFEYLIDARENLLLLKKEIKQTES